MWNSMYNSTNNYNMPSSNQNDSPVIMQPLVSDVNEDNSNNSNNNTSNTCMDFYEHVNNCPICGKFYNNDNSLYIIIIVLMIIVIIILLKRY